MFLLNVKWVIYKNYYYYLSEIYAVEAPLLHFRRTGLGVCSEISAKLKSRCPYP